MKNELNFWHALALKMAKDKQAGKLTEEQAIEIVTAIQKAIEKTGLHPIS